MPPGLTGDLCAGSPTARRPRSPRRRNNPGRTEQASPSCPASSQIGTTNVAAGPGAHPFHAVGRMYLAGPFKGAPLSLVAITPALAGPYDYGTQVVRVAINVDPLDAHVTAASDTRAADHRRHPAPPALDPGQHRPPGLPHGNPTNCSPFAVDSQGIGDQGTVVGFSSYFHADNCATLPFKPTMTIRQLGGRKSTAAEQEPPDPVRPADPRRRREPQIDLGDAAESVRDRPAPPRQHLLAGPARLRTLRRPPGDRHRDDDDAAARRAADRARPTPSPASGNCRTSSSSSTGR